MTTTAAREFHLGDILSVTTGRLVSPRHLDGVYDILNWMTGDNLFSHQLPRAADECEGPLLAQHPDLAAIVPPEKFDDKEDVDRWLAEQVTIYGGTRKVTPLATGEHARIDPLTELRMKVPAKRIIAAEVPGAPDGS